MDTALQRAAKTLAETLTAHDLTVTTAESCTGGLVTKTLCATESTADFHSCGFVTYSNYAKTRLLGVKPETLERYTAVSAQTVEEMARGAKERAGQDIGLSISGYAGPDGGEDGTPAGTVWFGWALPDGDVIARKKQFSGENTRVIEDAATWALTELTRLLETHR